MQNLWIERRSRMTALRTSAGPGLRHRREDRLSVLMLFLLPSVPAGQFCASNLNSATISNLLFPKPIMRRCKLLRES